MHKHLILSLVLLVVLAVITAVAFWQGPNSLLFAWVLNFMLMTGTLYLTQTLKFSLSSTYYQAKKWEKEGMIYQWFGVNIFRKLLVLFGWERLNKAANPVRKDLAVLKHLEYTSRQSEFGHLMIFFVVLAITIFVGIYYSFEQTISLITLNILLNFYPIAVQRYNRPRFQHAINNLKQFKP